MLLGCIADDLTGATDLALMLTRAGMKTVQVMQVPDKSADLSSYDAVVVALKTRTCPVGEAVSVSLAAADALLAGGRATGRHAARPGSPLHEALVDSGLAQGVSTETEVTQYPGLYSIGIETRAGADLASLEQALNATLQRAVDRAAPADVAAAAHDAATAFNLEADSNRSIADLLVVFEGADSYARIASLLDEIAAVGVDDVRAFARGEITHHERLLRRGRYARRVLEHGDEAPRAVVVTFGARVREVPDARALAEEHAAFEASVPREPTRATFGHGRTLPERDGRAEERGHAQRAE